VRFAYYGLLVAIALIIVVSIKLIGIILVSALLVIPGAAGMQIAKNYKGVMAISVGCAVCAVVLGLVISLKYDLASGASIVLVLFGLFVVALALSPRRPYMRAMINKWERKNKVAECEV
jgi:ABC-type Mn2+/Zn2+ transport system permease subunit